MGLATIRTDKKTNMTVDAEGEVVVFCCECTSPARVELDGRTYCFTHVPLMTNWQPVKKGKGK